MRPERTRLFSMLLVCGVLAGALAAAQSARAGDPIADRQRLMKLNGASWADIQAKVKAGNIEAVAVNAETIAVSAPQVPALFPEGSADASNAKPEIWQNWDKFRDLVKEMETRAVNLREAAKAKDAEAVTAQVKEFGPQACGACHTAFRKPLR